MKRKWIAKRCPLWHQLDERAQPAALADVVATVLHVPRGGTISVTPIDDAGDQLWPQ